MLNKENITHIKPYNRPTNLLFQSYALFPHLTVFKNIAYGLERENLSKEEIKERVDSIIARTSLDGLNNRKPDELSGGQKQRIGIARASLKKANIRL